MTLTIARNTRHGVGKTMGSCLPAFIIFLGAANPLLAGPTGPTLHLDYGRGRPLANPTAQFMYFVPLISPEPVFVFTNASAALRTRVTSNTCRVSGGAFQVLCEFEFDGLGSLQSVLDHTDLIRRRHKELAAGASLSRQLGSINVEGQGSGEVAVEGTVSNGVRSVNEVRLRFNGRGNPTPVSISLQDLSYRDGSIHADNELIARVNTLVFRRAAGPPTMQITVASVKRKDAGESCWQDFIGQVKGLVANQLLPPIAVDAAGHKAMLDFGLALANQEPTFAFPFAKGLKIAP